MDDRPNLREFLNEVSSFQEDEAPAAPAKAAGPAPTAIGDVVEIAGSGSQIRMDARSRRRAAVPRRSLDRHVGPGRQPDQDSRRQQLADRQRPHAARADDAGELVAHVDFLGEGTRDSAGKMTNFRRGVTRYPIPGAEVFPVTHRGHALDLRRERRAAYRDRHRLSDRRHPRRALRRPDARQAFRGAGIDRYRQVDQRLADPSPHLAS